MTDRISRDLLVRILQATPEQQAAIERVLDGKPEAPAPVPPTAAPADVEGFIGKAEAAKLLGVELQTLDRWLRAGRIPFYRVNHSVRLRWSEVQAHLGETCRVARRSR